MVVLGVECHDGLLLRVVPCGQDLVQLGVFPPLLGVDEPVRKYMSIFLSLSFIFFHDDVGVCRYDAEGT